MYRDPVSGTRSPKSTVGVPTRRPRGNLSFPRPGNLSILSALRMGHVAECQACLRRGAYVARHDLFCHGHGSWVMGIFCRGEPLSVRSHTAQWLGQVQEDREGPASGKRWNTLVMMDSKRDGILERLRRGASMRVGHRNCRGASRLWRQAKSPENALRPGGSGSSWGR